MGALNDGFSNGKRDFIVETIEITNVKDLSGEVKEWPNGSKQKFPFDIQLEIFFDKVIKGKSLEFSFIVGGNWKRDTNNEIIDIGSVFKVERIFQIAGYLPKFTDDSNSKITEDALRSLLGIKIKILSYPNTSERWTVSDIVYSAEVDDGILIKDFCNSFRKSGYPKNFVGLEPNSYTPISLSEESMVPAGNGVATDDPYDF